MAYIQPRKNKNGEIISYIIKVHAGNDYKTGKQLKPYSATFKVPKDVKWSEKKIQSEVQKFATLFEDECRKGMTTDKKQTFGEYWEYYISCKETTLKHNSIMALNSMGVRILTEFANAKLVDITTQQINKFYVKLSKMESANGKPLSRDTLLQHHRALTAVFNKALKERIITFNPATFADKPELPRHEAESFDLDEVGEIFRYL